MRLWLLVCKPVCRCFRKMKLHRNAVAYSATCLASAMMHNVFMFYYVKLFLNKYYISESWFQISQVCFMIWNALNDPLFGYCLDNCDTACMRTRRHAILYGAPWFALSFLLPWFPWQDYQPGSWLSGVHLLVSLFFYDAMFTFVLLSLCCVLAESSKKQEDRLRMTQYGQVASLIGSSSVFLCELVSQNMEHFHRFQATCVVIAIISYFCISYTGRNSRTEYDLQHLSDSKIEIKAVQVVKAPSESTDLEVSRDSSIFRLTWQILSQPDFYWFVTMNFFQEFHRSFLSSFLSIIGDTLIPQAMLPSGVRSLLYGSVFIVPQLFIIIGTPLISKYGHYRVLKLSFLVKIACGAVMLMIGRSHIWIFAGFIFIQGVTTFFVSPLTGLGLSDITDLDMEVYNRRRPLSSMVFGTNALVTKPAISLAPMITVYYLNKYGYEDFKKGKLTAAGDVHSLHSMMFILCCLVSGIVGFIQFFVWSKYKLRNSHKVVSNYIES